MTWSELQKLSFWADVLSVLGFGVSGFTLYHVRQIRNDMYFRANAHQFLSGIDEVLAWIEHSYVQDATQELVKVALLKIEPVMALLDQHRNSVGASSLSSLKRAKLLVQDARKQATSMHAQTGKVLSDMLWSLRLELLILRTLAGDDLERLRGGAGG